MLKKITILVLATTCISLTPKHLQAQLTLRGYVEIPVSKKENDFTIVSACEKGLLLIKKQEKIQQKKTNWHITTLDADLNSNEAGMLSIDYEYDLLGYETSRTHAFFLFHQPEFLAGDFQLFKLDLSDNNLEQFNIKHEGNLTLTHFCVANKSAILGGYIAEKPVVLIYHMGQPGSMTAVSGLFKRRARLLDMRVNTNNTFNAVLIEENILRRQYLITKIFSDRGQLIVSDSTTIDKDITITSGMISGLSRNDMIILGTYSQFSNKATTGLYAAPIDPQSNQSIQYHPFPMLEHFLDYMTPKRAEKIKFKTGKRIQQGKKPNYSVYLQPIRISETKAGFFLFSEMLNSTQINQRTDPYNSNMYYIPTYYRSYTSSYTPYNNPNYPRSYADTPYSNNKYTDNKTKYVQAALALFNGKGELLWDQSLDMQSVEYNSQVQLCDYTMGDSTLVIACKKDSDILINTTTSLVSTTDTLQITTTNESDIIMREYPENTGIKAWYKNYFYIWGYRDVRRITEPKSSNHVFYIGKLEAG